MYILFFLLWIVFNGQITTEIVLFGLVIAGAVYAFCCKFLDYSPKKDIFLLRKAGYILAFLGVLIWEIVKANAAVIHLILSPHLKVEPVIVRFRTELKSQGARVLLANSITLTPGTITVPVEENRFCVHCLDIELAEGLENSVFVELLKEMETEELRWK